MRTEISAARAKYNKVVALARRGATDGERAAGRAAQRRMLNACPAILDGHPLREIECGFRWEIVEALRACWTHNTTTHGWNRCTVETAWVLATLDFKEIRGAMAILRDEERKGWKNGEYHGNGDLKFYTCAEYMLERALVESMVAEGATEPEALAYARAA